jgi:hypothetical protein
MPLNVKTLSRAVFGLILVALLAVSQPAVAQQTLAGEWTASFDTEKPNRIQLNFERRTAKGGRNQMGSGYDFAELQGLTREQVASGGAVKFSLVREAGRIDCEGSFQNGKGSGTFRFTGNQSFVSAMKSRGFDLEKESAARGGEHDSEDRLFAATTLNVTTALADDLLSAGFGRLDVEDLFKAAIFKVDSRFAREMRASGFGDLDMEELVKARIFKIDADFARQVNQMGFADQSLENLVQMRIFKVTPEFIAEAKNEGLTNLSIQDLVQLRIFKIDAEFIRQARAEGVPIQVEKLVERSIHGRRTR